MEVLKEYWAIFTALIGFLVWLLRLESGMLGNRKDIRRMEEQRKEDVRNASHQRDKMEERMGEIAGDIKQILILLNTKEDRK